MIRRPLRGARPLGGALPPTSVLPLAGAPPQATVQLLAGALLLLAIGGCSGRCCPGEDLQAYPGKGGPPQLAAYPVAGQVGGMFGSGSQAPASGSLQTSPATFVPLETGEFVRQVASGIPADVLSQSGSTTFSPDGAWLAYASRHDGAGQFILHVGPASGPASPTEYVTTGQIFWSPDSRRLAFAQIVSAQHPQRVALRSWDLEARRVGTIVEDVAAPQPWVSWVDGGVVFIEGNDLLYKAKDADPVRLSAVADSHLGIAGGRAIFPSPDGKRVAFLAPAIGFTAAASLVVHNLRTNDAKVIRRVPKDLTPLVWSEASDALGYLTGGFGQYELHKVRIDDGSEEVTPFYLGEPTVEKGPNWTSVSGPSASHLSPNLRWCLVSRGGPLYAREMATGRHVQLTSSRVTPLPSAWTADSRHIFVYVRGGEPERVAYYKVQVEQ